MNAYFYSAYLALLTASHHAKTFLWKGMHASEDVQKAFCSLVNNHCSASILSVPWTHPKQLGLEFKDQKGIMLRWVKVQDLS